MTRLPLLLATATVAALAIHAVQPCMAADGPDVAAWRLLADAPPFPPSLAVPFGVYDPVRQRVLVIDGDYVHQPLVIHVFEPTPSPHWSTLDVAGQAPVDQYLPAIVYDPVRDRLLIMDGHLASVTVWTVPLSGTPTWQKLATTGVSPGERVGFSATYDAAHDRVITFGGVAGYPQQFLSDTWELSLATNRWHPLVPAGAPPGGREGHGALYDPVQQRMLVFGGHYEAASRGFWNDVFQLSLGDSPEWSEIHPAGPLPGARSAFGTIYDPVRKRMLIHGGVNADSGIEPDDLWALSLDGDPTWTLIATANRLRGRSYPVDVYDPVTDALVACGGGSYPLTSELSLGSPLAWRAVLPESPLRSPSPRSFHAVVRDSRRDRFTVVGGAYSQVDSSLWNFEPGHSGWTAANPQTGFGVSVVGDPMRFAEYDSSSDRIVTTLPIQALNLSGSGAGTWGPLVSTGTQVGADIPPDANIAADAPMTIDSRRHQMIMSGGFFFYPHSGSFTESGVWALALDESGAWEHLGSLPFEYGSAEHASFYDPVRDRLVIVGGIARPGRLAANHRGSVVWTAALDSNLAWTDRTSMSGATPPGPPDARVAFDAVRDRLFVIADTRAWVRGVEDVGPWTNLSFASPTPFVSNEVRYDPGRNEVVALFASRPGTGDVQAWALTYGPPSVLLASSVISSQAIALKWDSPAAIGRAAVLERRDGDAAWAEQGPLTFDDFGLATSTDPDVTLGHRYDYRVRIALGGTNWTSAPVTIAMPPDGSLALLAPTPNPTVGSLRVAFHLPEPGAARVEAYDVNGRRCGSREVGTFGPGTHTIAFGEDGSLHPGVYWVRLVRGNEIRSVRVVLMR